MLGGITPKSHPLASCCSTTVHLMSLKSPPSPFLFTAKDLYKFKRKEIYCITSLQLANIFKIIVIRMLE